MKDDARLTPEALAERVTNALARAAAGELLGPNEIAAIFGFKHTAFAVRNKRGDFDVFKVRPAIGENCFSGVLVHRYLQGEPVEAPTFGQKRRRA